MRKARIITLISVLTVLLVSASSFLLWASSYYHAEESAVALMADSSSVEMTDRLILLPPNTPNGTGILFYPGAKVEAIAYLPILDKLRDRGYSCALVKMPLNMAIFDANAADGVITKLPDIQKWYIAGHSMGGAMASSYASKNPDKVEGLLLLGAYLYGNYPEEKALTVYGSFNDNLEPKITYTKNIVKIEGGNHAQFGNYGKQKGDPDATISAEKQQDMAVEAIVRFIEK